MKAVLVIADEKAERPIEELGRRTPLEAALKPSMNRIAKTGICGVLDPLPPETPPGSDAATARALGSGVRILPGDVAFKCNFATVDKNLTVRDRRSSGHSSIEPA